MEEDGPQIIGSWEAASGCIIYPWAPHIPSRPDVQTTARLMDGRTDRNDRGQYLLSK